MIDKRDKEVLFGGLIFIVLVASLIFMLASAALLLVPRAVAHDPCNMGSSFDSATQSCVADPEPDPPGGGLPPGVEITAPNVDPTNSLCLWNGSTCPPYIPRVCGNTGVVTQTHSRSPTKPEWHMENIPMSTWSWCWDLGTLDKFGQSWAPTSSIWPDMRLFGDDMLIYSRVSPPANLHVMGSRVEIRFVDGASISAGQITCDAGSQDVVVYVDGDYVTHCD